MKKSIVITSLFLILTAVSCGSNNYGGMKRNAIKAEFENTNVFYVVNTTFDDPYLYAWKDGGSENAAWRGERMESMRIGEDFEGHPIYKVELSDEFDKAIINGYVGGEFKQTWDINLAWELDQGNMLTIGEYTEWNKYSVLTGNYVPLTTTYHFDMYGFDAPDADERYALFLYKDGVGSEWVDLTKQGSHYTYEIPIEDQGKFNMMIVVRFGANDPDNNWDKKWNQTADIPLRLNGEYFMRINDIEGGYSYENKAQAAKNVLFAYSNGESYRYSKTTSVTLPDVVWQEHLHCGSDPMRVTHYNGAYLYMDDKDTNYDLINSGYMDYDNDMWHFYKNGDGEDVRDWKVTGESVYTYYYSLYNFIKEDVMDFEHWEYVDGHFEYAVTSWDLDEHNHYENEVVRAFQYFALPMVLDTAGAIIQFDTLKISEVQIGETRTLLLSILKGGDAIATASIIPE